MNAVSEYGSLKQIKTQLGFTNGSEQLRYQGEFIRNFLRNINEIDEEDNSYNIARLSYNGDLTLLPKRFSIHQDIWGNYNGISSSMSPFIRLPYHSNTDASQTRGFNTDHFAFVHPSTSDDFFDQGRKWEADIAMASIGQIDSVILETGAFLHYEYDLHEYPNDHPDLFFQKGGLRINSFIKGSENGSVNKIKYEYFGPTIINTPIFIDQHPLDRYYKNLESKVKTSWKPLNNWQMNKGGYVGYKRVVGR